MRKVKYRKKSLICWLAEETFSPIKRDTSNITIFAEIFISTNLGKSFVFYVESSLAGELTNYFYLFITYDCFLIFLCNDRDGVLLFFIQKNVFVYFSNRMNSAVYAEWGPSIFFNFIF